VLGAVLVRVTVAVPPFLALPPLVGGPASLNIYVGLVGPSGAGKGAAEAVARDAVRVGHLETASIGSGEGIAHLFARRVRPKGQPSYVERTAEAVLFVVPEVDTLKALDARQGSTLFGELRKGWVGEPLGFAYADPDKRLPIDAHTYRLGLLVGVQPDRAGVLLDDADAGTPQRFVWLPATDPAAPDLAPPEPAPWPWSPGFLVGVRDSISVCQVAREYVDADRLARVRGNGQGLDAHAALARLKVAAALALLEDRAEVGEEDWRLAAVVMGVSTRTRAAVVDVLASSSRERNRRRGEAEADRAIVVEAKTREAAVDRVARVIVRHLDRAGDWVIRSELRRGVTARDREHFDAAIDGLVEARTVMVDEAGAGTRYRLAKRP